MRLVLVAISLVLVGCSQTAFDAQIIPGDDDGSATGITECDADFECAATAAKCCDCPTFAVPRTDPTFTACEGVACPTPTSCPSNVAPACHAGQCVLACVPMTCTTSCDEGFAIDANGCLTCDCAQVVSPACVADTDCVRVPADCCGCVLGGADTAVPAGDQSAHQGGLQCPSNPSCPQVDSCAPDLAPRCVEGACELISGALPTTACGRSDLAACPSGDTCTVNYDDAATAQGVGVCLPRNAVVGLPSTL